MPSLCSRRLPSGNDVAPVEDADVVEPKEAALENVATAGVLPIHPPGEVDEQLVEDRFEKSAVAFPGGVLLDLVDAPCGPADDRRIDVAEIPFVGRDLAVGMLVPFAHNDIELRLGKMRIDESERDAMKGQVPGRVPGKFPGVGHRHHPLIVEMAPFRVAAGLALVRRRRLGGIALQPLLDDVIIELLRPEHPGERLPLDGTMFVAQATGSERAVKLVRFRPALREEI